MAYREVPAQLSLPDLENRVLAWWDEHQTFDKLREQNSDGEPWSFLDGPITANNRMGVHHAWGRTYKDIYQRYHAMLGQRQRYQNGFDCQGLWVEVEVEKEFGFASKRDIEEFGIDKFVEACMARVRKFAGEITEQSKRLGMWMDWDNSYFTMAEDNNYMIWHFLKKCHERGLIHPGHDVMPWCPRCGTAISDQEIVTEGYQDITHLSIFVKFPIVGRENESLVAWTTTPWTLTANVGAAIDPELTYVEVHENGETLYLAKGCLERTMKGKDHEVVREFPGSELLGLEYSGPFDELPAQDGVTHTVIAWDEVTEDEGTGIVHIAPGCGREDHLLSKEHGLAVIAPIDESGIIVDGFGEFTGERAGEVSQKVVESLKERGRLYRTQKYSHRYPVCWRCSSELLFRLVDEWFIGMDELRPEMSEVTRKINWLPPYGLEHELDWLKNMGDWMISKKRYWGLALPIYPCQSCGNVDVIGGRDELKERAVEGWDEFDGHTPHRPWIDGVKIACSSCGEAASRIKDVGNPWLDAGIVPYSTMGYLEDPEYWKTWFPAQFITESLPGQFRNWFYSLLAMSTVLENREPFKNVLGFASLRDMNGDDMHKSKGNAIWFDDAAEDLGAESMRWLYARNNPYNNLNFGAEAVEEPKRHISTLWNTYKFFVTYADIDGYDPDALTVPYGDLQEIDRWILARLNQLVTEVRVGYDSFSATAVMRSVESFIEDLSNWYLRRCRDRFRQMDSTGDPAAYQTLYTALTTLVGVLAPVVPMFAEEIYRNLVAWRPDAAESVHLTKFPEPVPEWDNAELLDRMSTARKVVEVALAARNEAKLRVRQPLAEMTVAVDTESRRNNVIEYRDTILDELNVKSIVVVLGSESLTELIARPNFKSIGPRFGKRANEVGNNIRAIGQDELSTLSTGGTITLQVDGVDEVFGPDDVMIETSAPVGLAVAQDGPITVALETTLTPELENEGLAREIVNRVQNMRRQADFNVSDRIVIGYQVSPRLEQAIEVCRDYIAGETLALDVAPRVDDESWHEQAQWQIDGESAELSVRRVDG
jgi:isoleucyl-tRNA synthetase